MGSLESPWDPWSPQTPGILEVPLGSPGAPLVSLESPWDPWSPGALLLPTALAPLVRCPLCRSAWLAGFLLILQQVMAPDFSRISPSRGNRG